MMLRKRSRNTSEQALMADFTSSPTEISRNPNPISSIFGSPRLFTTESESLQSPTSILDSKPFSILKKPFWSESQSSKSPNPNFTKLDSRKKVGLGIVEEDSDPKMSRPETRMVVFGSQLKIQIPPLPPQSSLLSPNSPPEFGIKTRKKSFGSGNNTGLESSVSPRVFISASEMELSEEYTCVITHGPNPKTTHIFDDCIVESCCGVVGVCSEKRERKGNGYGNGFGFGSLRYPSESFLSFCYTCNKSLGQGKDIYMYRGEKAFCSSECRYKEMVLDEGTTMGEFDHDDAAFGDSTFKGF